MSPFYRTFTLPASTPVSLPSTSFSMPSTKGHANTFLSFRDGYSASMWQYKPALGLKQSHSSLTAQFARTASEGSQIKTKRFLEQEHVCW